MPKDETTVIPTEECIRCCRAARQAESNKWLQGITDFTNSVVESASESPGNTLLALLPGTIVIPETTLHPTITYIGRVIRPFARAALPIGAVVLTSLLLSSILVQTVTLRIMSAVSRIAREIAVATRADRKDSCEHCIRAELLTQTNRRKTVTKTASYRIPSML